MRRRNEIHPAWVIAAFIISMLVVGTINHHDQTAAASHAKEYRHKGGR